MNNIDIIGTIQYISSGHICFTEPLGLISTCGISHPDLFRWTIMDTTKKTSKEADRAPNEIWTSNMLWAIEATSCCVLFGLMQHTDFYSSRCRLRKEETSEVAVTKD